MEDLEDFDYFGTRLISWLIQSKYYEEVSKEYNKSFVSGACRTIFSGIFKVLNNELEIIILE